MRSVPAGSAARLGVVAGRGTAPGAAGASGGGFAPGSAAMAVGGPWRGTGVGAAPPWQWCVARNVGVAADDLLPVLQHEPDVEPAARTFRRPQGGTRRWREAVRGSAGCCPVGSAGPHACSATAGTVAPLATRNGSLCARAGGTPSGRTDASRSRGRKRFIAAMMSAPTRPESIARSTGRAMLQGRAPWIVGRKRSAPPTAAGAPPPAAARPGRRGPGPAAARRRHRRHA